MHGFKTTWVAMCLMAVTLINERSHGQEEDSRELAIKYPPSMLSPDGADLALQQIDWRLKQLRNKQANVEMQLANKRAKMEQSDQEIQKTQQVISDEFRFATDDARGQVVSRCLQEILSTRLDLASREAMLTDSVPKTNDEPDAQTSLRKAQIELAIEKLIKQIEILNEQVQYEEKLLEKKVASVRELDNAKTRLMSTEFELKQAMLTLQLFNEETENSVPDFVVETRREIAALKAREKSAKEFLNQLNAAATASRLVHRGQEAIRMDMEELAILRKQLMEIEFEIFEAESLAKLVKQEMQSTEVAPSDPDDQ